LEEEDLTDFDEYDEYPDVLKPGFGHREFRAPQRGRGKTRRQRPAPISSQQQQQQHPTLKEKEENEEDDEDEEDLAGQIGGGEGGGGGDDDDSDGIGENGGGKDGNDEDHRQERYRYGLSGRIRDSTLMNGLAKVTQQRQLQLQRLREQEGEKANSKRESAYSDGGGGAYCRLQMRRRTSYGVPIYRASLTGFSPDMERENAKMRELNMKLLERESTQTGDNNTARHEFLKGFTQYQQRPQYEKAGMVGIARMITNYAFVDNAVNGADHGWVEMYVALENLQSGLSMRARKEDISVTIRPNSLNVTIRTITNETFIPDGGGLVANPGDQVIFYWIDQLAGEVIPPLTKWKLSNGILLIRMKKRFAGMPWKSLGFKSLIPKELFWRGNNEEFDPSEQLLHDDKVTDHTPKLNRSRSIHKANAANERVDEDEREMCGDESFQLAVMRERARFEALKLAENGDLDDLVPGF